MSGEPVSLLAGLGWLRPAWLLALLPLPALLWALGRAARDRDAWSDVVDAPLRPFVTRTRAARPGGILSLGAGLAIAIIALAGPALPGRGAVAERNDALRVLVVDLSPAATAANAPTPFERVRLKLLDLLRAAPPAQTALIVYADEPYLVVPPTTDTATVALFVAELGADTVPVPGNRPGRAFRMAAALLADSGTARGELLWITAAPSAPDVMATLGALGPRTRISVLAFGPDAAAPQPLARAIAESGGTYVTLRADDADIRALAAASSLAPVRWSPHAGGAPREIGVGLLPLLLPLAALGFRRGVLFVGAFALLPLAPPADAAGFAELWLRGDQQGMRRLQAGEPEAAAALFADPRWRAVAYFRAGRYDEAAALLAPFGDADSHYNRGNALAHAERFDEALAAYDEALRLRPADPDILHNREIVRALRDRSDDGQRDGEPEGGSDRPPGQPPSAGSGSERRVPDGGAPGPRADTPATPAPPSGAAPAQAAPAGGASPAPGRSDPQREAAMVAEQWLRRVPDEPASLLRRKLLLEQRRRDAGEAPRPWQ